MNRRTFAALAGAAAGSLALKHVRAAALLSGSDRIGPVGLGLFSIPKLLDRDFGGALKLLAEIGYREVEFFGPYPFSAPETIERWKPLGAALGFAGSGYFGRTPQQVREILEENGLSSPSMHTDLTTLRTHLEPLAEAAHVVGHRYVIIPAIPQEDRAGLDAYKRLADEFNEIGARALELGLRFAYHNHGYGLTEMEGEVPFDVVLERTDPKLVDFQMDLYWTIAGGADPVAYLEAYPGRFRLMHIKDMTKQVRFSGDGGAPQQWMELFPYMTDAGAGVLDLRTILSRAKRSGVRHFIVERDLVENPQEALRRSYRYLAGLELER